MQSGMFDILQSGKLGTVVAVCRCRSAVPVTESIATCDSPTGSNEGRCRCNSYSPTALGFQLWTSDLISDRHVFSVSNLGS